VDLEHVFHLFAQARILCQHTDYVVIGSNAALAFAPDTPLPPEMTMSLDVDAYTKADPSRVFDLAAALGEASPFREREGYFLDPVSPALPTLPAGWENRLVLREHDGLRIWFLDPNDTAISKLARGEPRDLRWVKAGVACGLVSLPVLRHRSGQTRFADGAERAKVKHFAAKRVWP